MTTSQNFEIEDNKIHNYLHLSSFIQVTSIDVTPVLAARTEVSHSRDTVALQEQSADKRVSKDVEESEPRVEREDPNITAVCQDYTTR